jgi:hypothetical protein
LGDDSLAVVIYFDISNRVPAKKMTPKQTTANTRKERKLIHLPPNQHDYSEDHAQNNEQSAAEKVEQNMRWDWPGRHVKTPLFQGLGYRGVDIEVEVFRCGFNGLFDEIFHSLAGHEDLGTVRVGKVLGVGAIDTTKSPNVRMSITKRAFLFIFFKIRVFLE